MKRTIFSLARRCEGGAEFRENVKKYGKVAFDAAIDHLPKTLSALAEEGLITTGIGIATGGFGITAYGIYKMVDVASSIPEIKNQLEAIYENWGNISHRKKIEETVKLIEDFAVSYVIKAGEKVKIGENARLGIRKEVEKVANMQQFIL